jgi:Phage integrase family
VLWIIKDRPQRRSGDLGEFRQQYRQDLHLDRARWSLAIEQMADPSGPSSPQTCIAPIGNWFLARSVGAGAAVQRRAAGREPEIARVSVYTDDGAVHEHRGLKGRTKGRPNPKARRPARKVPIPPQLAALLRDHIQAYGVARDGRLFRSERGNPVQPSTWWRAWQKARAASLTPEQLATPLMKRPYDLRHSGITWRLDSGVPDAQVAAWAGHSVEMLRRVYAGRAAGLEGVWIARMDQTLPQDKP